jgi:DinB superfamily/Pentapeptide repeats (8 copies)
MIGRQFFEEAAMAAQYGPHRWSAGYHDNGNNDAFREADFTVADLTGAKFVDCDMTGVKIVDSWLVGVDISGFIHTFTINGVDVTDYVNAELDRRHPERVQLRQTRTPDDHRALWDAIERLWSDALARAERLPEPTLHERVDGEWSFVETLRHLVYITDSWAGRTILDESNPFHRLALPQTAYAPEDAAALGMDLAARPAYTEVVKVRAERMARVRSIVAGLTEAELDRLVKLSPAPGYPEEPRTVRDCIGVVMEEECEHYRFATRDLAKLESTAI